MAQTAEVIPFGPYLSEKDKPRGKSMVVMRVVNRKTDNLPLPGGHLLTIGTHDIAVYEDDVATIKALVEKRMDRWTEAQERFTLEIVKDVHKALSYPGDIEQLQAVIKSRSNADINARYDLLLQTTPLSPEGEFASMVGRDILPLDSAEVISTGIAEPARRGTQSEQQAFVESMAQVMRESNKELATTLAQALGTAMGAALRDALGGGDPKKK